MSESDTTRLALPLTAASQAQKHVTHNEAILRLDGLVQMTALSYTTSAQPTSPSDGDLYLLPVGKTGDDWGGYSNHAVAHYYDGIWHQYRPGEGWLCFVRDSGLLYYYNGSQWKTVALASDTLPLFSGHPSSNSANVTGNGTNVTLVCDSVFVDQGSNYNTQPGSLRLPRTAIMTSRRSLHSAPGRDRRRRNSFPRAS